MWDRVIEKSKSPIKGIYVEKSQIFQPTVALGSGVGVDEDIITVV